MRHQTHILDLFSEWFLRNENPVDEVEYFVSYNLDTGFLSAKWSYGDIHYQRDYLPGIDSEGDTTFEPIADPVMDRNIAIFQEYFKRLGKD